MLLLKSALCLVLATFVAAAPPPANDTNIPAGVWDSSAPIPDRATAAEFGVELYDPAVNSTALDVCCAASWQDRLCADAADRNALLGSSCASMSIGYALLVLAARGACVG